MPALHANWTLMRCLSRHASATGIDEGHGSRSLQIPSFESIDAKAGRSDQIVRLAIEMAAARYPLPQRREPVLPAGDAGFGGTAVLGEEKLATGFEDATHLRERRCGV